jgi:hypothetical protein
MILFDQVVRIFKYLPKIIYISRCQKKGGGSTYGEYKREISNIKFFDCFSIEPM